MSTDKPWSVNLHYEDPEKEDSDGCVTGDDFDTEAEARQCLSDFLAGKSSVFTDPRWHANVPYVELVGPNVREITRRSKQIAKREREQDEKGYRDMARHEQAMQAGMGLGIGAYNEAMGFDSEPYDRKIHEDS